jgi:hypothetical protein
MSGIQTFLGVQDVGILAQAIVDTVAEPLVVLDSDLRVVTASRSFYLTFQVNRQNTQGELRYDLGEDQWDIAELRTLHQFYAISLMATVLENSAGLARAYSKNAFAQWRVASPAPI